MSNYNRNDRSGNRGGDYRRRDSGSREMHRAVCDECGNNCEVPFKPTRGKPIYCNNCFKGKDQGSSRSDRSDSRRPSYQDRDNNKQLLEQVSMLNTKLDKIVLFLESSAKKKVTSKTISTKKPAKKTSPKGKKATKAVK